MPGEHDGNGSRGPTRTQSAATVRYIWCADPLRSLWLRHANACVTLLVLLDLILDISRLLW
jgi:hypothetical protein